MIEPRICHVPDGDPAAGREAVELAEAAGISLDPWQRYGLENSSRENPDGTWSAFQVGLCVPRQNGKSEIAVVRILAGLVLFREGLQIFSSNLFAASVEIHRRLAAILEANEDLSRLVKQVIKSHGSEGVEMMNGARVHFRARGAGAGRGHSPSVIYFDESMYLPAATFADLVPSVSAQHRQQIWLLGSAADERIHPDALVFARMREAAIAGDAGRLAFFEWSAPFEADGITEARAADPEMLRQANPGTESGRLSLERMAAERGAVDLETFCRERMGVSPWPRGDGTSGVIPGERWERCFDTADAEPLSPLVLAFDVSLDRTSVAIAVCWHRADGSPLCEVVDVCELADAVFNIAELHGRHKPAVVVGDSKGGAALVPALEAAHVKVKLTSATEYQTAADLFYDSVMAVALRYRPVTEWARDVDRAVAAGARGVGWDRKRSSGSIATLVALTLAHWGACTLAAPYDGPLLEWIG